MIKPTDRTFDISRYIKNDTVHIRHHVTDDSNDIVIKSSNKTNRPIRVILEPVSSKTIHRLYDSKPMITNKLGSNFELCLSNYDVVFEASTINCPVFVDKAHNMDNCTIIVSNESEIITFNPSLNMLIDSNLNEIDLDAESIEAVDEWLNIDSTLYDLNSRRPNVSKISLQSIVSNSLHNISNSRIRIDSSINIQDAICFGILGCNINTIKNTHLTINGDANYSNSKVSGLMVGSCHDISNASVKIRGNVSFDNCDVMGLISGILSNVSGNMIVDVRLGLELGNINRFGIISGYSRDTINRKHILKFLFGKRQRNGFNGFGDVCRLTQDDEQIFTDRYRPIHSEDLLDEDKKITLFALGTKEDEGCKIKKVNVVNKKEIEIERSLGNRTYEIAKLLKRS